MTEPARCLLHPRHTLAPTEIRTCGRCVAVVRADLTSIAHCYALLRVQVEIVGQLATPTVNTIPAALVMLGAGSASTSWAYAYDHGPSGDPSDPPAVAFELWTWAEDWAAIRHEDPPDYLTVAGLVWWLGGPRLTWAMSHHPAADEFAADMDRIRAHLEGATAMGTATQRGAHCLDCPDVRLSRPYGSERWSCPLCHRDYDDVAMWLAVRADMEADRERGAVWVTLVEAAHAAGRSHRTLRTWVNTGVVSGACRTVDHAALVWLPDVMDATAAAYRRNRDLQSAAAW